MCRAVRKVMMRIMFKFIVLLCSTLSVHTTDLPSNRLISPTGQLRSQLQHISGVSMRVALSLSAPSVVTASGSRVELKDLETTSLMIEQNCQQMLRASRSTGKFLYRGEGARKKLSRKNDDKCLRIDDPSNLFDQSAYGSFLAADYFSYLNTSIQFPVYKAHIATPSLLRASQWGGVFSIWPLGDFYYLWLKSNVLLWDNEWSLPQNPRGALFWRNMTTFNSFTAKNCLLNTDLEAAIQADHEVMFASSSASTSAFIAVPYRLEGLLRKRLKIPLQTTDIPIRRATANMELEDDIRTKRDRYDIRSIENEILRRRGLQ